MSFEASPKQALVLWSLVVAAPGEEPSRSTVKPSLSATERKQLISANLIEEEKRGRATHLLLTDRGWEWAEQQNQLKLSRSTYSSPVLEKLIQALRGYLGRNDIRLAEVIANLRLPEQGLPQHDGNENPRSVKELIRSACLSLTGGDLARRVRLASLRRALPDLSVQSLDEALLQMDRSRTIQLMALEQPSEITTEDTQAAIFIAGQPRHIVYLNS